VIPPELVQKITSHDQLLQQMTDERTRASVDSFFADPKNEFAAELAPDILQLLKEGSARDLPTAYKLALWQNEAVRRNSSTRRSKHAPVPKPTLPPKTRDSKRETVALPRMAPRPKERS
jgi:hypothetical protein